MQQRHQKLADKMQQVLQYLLEHLDKEITLEDAASHFHNNPVYFAKIFEEYFELPFQKYVTKLKLRRAAKDLYQKKSLKNISEIYGYATTGGFSKAFRKEFGLSPREFVKRGRFIPDMPLRSSIENCAISMNYERTGQTHMAGCLIPRDSEEPLDIFEDIAYAHMHPAIYPYREDSCPRIGVWWCDDNMRLYYLLGSDTATSRDTKTASSSDDKVSLLIPEENYAVFHLTLPDSLPDTEEDRLRYIGDISRQLARYIRDIWVPSNEKSLKYMGYIYEVFDKQECRIYIPLLKGMGGTQMNIPTENGTDTWIQYIDEHILEDITIRQIAEHFHYSPNHFADIFRLYYDMDLLDYIQKRKLYQIARELKDHKIHIQEIPVMYHYKSYEHFAGAFFDEFHTTPERYGEIQFKIVDLPEYYQNNKDRLKVSYRYIDELSIAAMEIKSVQDNTEHTEDIPALCNYYFLHDFSCLAGTPYACPSKGKEDKIGLWHSIKDPHTGQNIHQYMLGPVTSDFRQIPLQMQKISISGGKYAVFETEHSTDRHDLENVYRMMTICVLYGWIKEYRVRVDLKRITFMRYYHGKLYTYVPIYE